MAVTDTPVRLTTLPRRADFLRAARGRRHATPGFVIQACCRPSPAGEEARLGLTCSRKVGNAVVRNRARRRLRALAREVLGQHGRPGWDYVLIGRAQATVSHDFAAMRADLLAALARLHRPRREGAEVEPAAGQPGP
ncbi:MAG: ribonuclease P protein component [Alkalilacustris sp.]